MNVFDTKGRAFCENDKASIFDPKGRASIFDIPEIKRKILLLKLLQEEKDEMISHVHNRIIQKWYLYCSCNQCVLKRIRSFDRETDVG
tara:strand:- start:12024 stop:12287 length:264 start_codon:yes stop_codon:yes gene_type:complete